MRGSAAVPPTATLSVSKTLILLLEMEMLQHPIIENTPKIQKIFILEVAFHPPPKGFPVEESSSISSTLEGLLYHFNLIQDPESGAKCERAHTETQSLEISHAEACIKTTPFNSYLGACPPQTSSFKKSFIIRPTEYPIGENFPI